MNKKTSALTKNIMESLNGNDSIVIFEALSLVVATFLTDLQIDKATSQEFFSGFFEHTKEVVKSYKEGMQIDSKPWFYCKYEPIPVNPETYDELYEELISVLDSKPTGECVVALTSLLNNLITKQQTHDITFDQVVGILAALYKKEMN